MVRVSVAEARERLSELIEAARQGEIILISEAGLDVASLGPVPLKQKRQFGSARGLVTMADDFDAPLDDFEAYGP